MLAAMKTTLDLRDDLLAAARARAASEQTSLDKLIEEGLSLRLRSPIGAKRARNELPVSTKRGGLLRGIDPLSNQSLLDAADKA
jgi:hypothetical protein